MKKGLIFLFMLICLYAKSQTETVSNDLRVGHNTKSGEIFINDTLLVEWLKEHGFGQWIDVPGGLLYSNTVSVGDTLVTPVLSLGDSILHAATYGDTIATKKYVDDNSGAPSGVDGDIQINNGGVFGTIADQNANHKFNFDGNNYIWGDYGTTYSDYIRWATGVGGSFEFVNNGTSSEFNSIYLSNGSGYFETTNSSGYGGSLDISSGTGKVVLKVVTSSGTNNLELNQYGIRVTNPNYSNYGGDYLVTGETSGAMGTWTFPNGDATPTVASASILYYGGTSTSVTITDLDNAVSGAVYRVVGTSDTYSVTINDSGNFNLSATWIGGIDDVITLLCVADNDYIEISRSGN